MFGSLRKKLEEVTAQLNPFDSGKTASTVRAARQRQVAPVQTVRKPVQSTAPLTTRQRVDATYGNGISGITNRLKDIVDPNTEADKIKRFSNTGLMEDYNTEQKRKTDAVLAKPSTRGSVNQFASSGLREAVNFGGKSLGSALNTVGSVIQSKNPIVKTVRSAVPFLNAAGNADAQLGGEGGKLIQKQGQSLNKFVDNKVTQSSIGERKNENKLVVGAGGLTTQLPLQLATGGAGLVNTGLQTASDEYNKARATGKTNDQALGIGLLQGGASAASEKLGIDRFLPGNGVTGNILTKAGKRFLTEGAQEAQQQFTSNLISNKTYNPNQSLKEGVGQSFLLGGIAGGIMSPVSDLSQRPPTTSLVKSKPSFTPQDIEVMKDISENQMNPQNYTPREAAILQKAALDIYNRTGVDLITGSRSDINVKAGQAIENFQNRQAPLRQLKTMPVVTDKQPTTSLVSRVKSMFPPLNEVGAIGSDVRPDANTPPIETLKKDPMADLPELTAQQQQAAKNAKPPEPQSTREYNKQLDDFAKEVKAKIPVQKPSAFQKNLELAGIKPKGLILKETKPINGQKKQIVRTGKGQVEQRTVTDPIADALDIPQEQRVPTKSFDQQAMQSQRVADNVNSSAENVYVNQQPKDIKQKKSKTEFTDTFNRWLGTKQAAETRSVSIARTLPKLNKNDALEAIQAIDNSGYVPKSKKAQQFVDQFRAKTDQLYQRYTGEKGVNMGYVEDYLPRIYKNPEGGEPLTKAEYQALQMSTGRMRGRESDLLDVDALITKDPRELLAKYVDSMENVVNNRSFVDSLKKSGHLIEAPTRPQGTVLIDAPGFPQPRVFTNPDTGEKIQGNYYATPDVAKVLNRSFEPDIRTSTSGKILKKTAAAASKVQDLGLSGGVPGTPINAFGFAQILRNTMGGNIRGSAKGTALSFSKKLTDRYFDKHSEDLAELQEQGINVRTNYTEKGLQSFMKRVATAENKKGKSTATSKAKELFNQSWEGAMNDPTFGRLLPVMQLDYYRHVRDNLKRFGVAPDKAAQIASKRLKEFEGLTDQATLSGRNKVANDALTTFLFAPKYRESMIKFWANNVKALAPQNVVKALNPKSGEYRSNLIFNAAAMFLFLMMDKENQEQNEGRHLWDNPDGKKDKLLIKLGNGQTVGIPFLSSIATMPRTALNIGNDIISGNTEQLGKDAKGFLGYGIRPLADILTNEDYFGNKIRKEGASGAENLKRSAQFAFGQYNHPYVRGLMSKAYSDRVKDPTDPKYKSDLQILSESAESPLRFYKDKSIKYGLMYQDFDKELKNASNQTKKQFERWHPGRNEYGELEPFDDNNFYSKERADALQDNDLFKVEKRYAELQNKYHGKPIDPIFNLSEEQRRLVLNKKALKPGQTDPQLSQLYKNEWYQDYQNASSQYYASKNAWNTAQGFKPTINNNNNPYPEVPAELQKAMDYYSSLPKGTGDRSSFIKANPDVWQAMTNQWAMKDDWENKERAKYGLAATEGDAGIANGFKQGTSKYASYGKGGKRGSKYDWTKNLFDNASNESTSTTKSLRAILEKAMKGKS